MAKQLTNREATNQWKIWGKWNFLLRKHGKLSTTKQSPSIQVFLYMCKFLIPLLVHTAAVAGMQDMLNCFLLSLQNKTTYFIPFLFILHML